MVNKYLVLCLLIWQCQAEEGGVKILINNIDIKKYNAILSEKKISPLKTTINVTWNKGSLTPIFFDKDTKFCNIECKFTFVIKDSKEDTFEKIFSDFCSNLEDCVLKFDNINMNYQSYILNISAPIRVTMCDWEVTLNWQGYKFEDEKVEILNKITSKEINVAGNLDTPCIVEITPTIDIIDLKIEGLADDSIIIKNLKKDKTIIVNGVDGLVTQEGINKFQDTDMWEFPRLKSGINNIKISRNECNIKIKYNPRWI